MSSEVPAAKSIGQRITDELKEFLVLAAYLYVCFTALAYLKAAILQAHGIAFAPFGFAAVKALICAKFMSVGHALHMGERYKSQALIWPTLYRSLVFVALLLVLSALEEIISGIIQHRTLLRFDIERRRRHARSAHCHEFRRAADPHSFLRVPDARRGRR